MQSWHVRRGALILVPVAVALTVSGCFDSHDDDAGLEGGSADGSVDARAGDAARDASNCSQLGGYRTCGSLCDEPCGWVDGIEYFCDRELSICRPFPELGCRFDRNAPERPEDPRSLYCRDGSVCSVGSEAEISEDGTSGRCVSADFCREGAAAGVDVVCVYSDLTRVAEPPPSVPCPPSFHEDLGFCGGECPGCADDGTFPALGWPSCAGINGSRAFGVCSFFTETACHVGDLSPLTNDACRRLIGDDCACLMLRGPTGDFPEVGYTTMRTSCLEYRRHFPEGDVDCYDIEAWTSIPE